MAGSPDPATGSNRRVVLDDLPAGAVAAELGISVSAVLIAKSRVVGRLRQEARGLVD